MKAKNSDSFSTPFPKQTFFTLQNEGNGELSDGGRRIRQRFNLAPPIVSPDKLLQEEGVLINYICSQDFKV